MGAARPGRHSAGRPRPADAGASHGRRPRPRGLRAAPPPSRWRWGISAAALAASAALVAAGLIGGSSPVSRASQASQLDASSRPAGTEFGVSVMSAASLAHDTRIFGRLPIVRTPYLGVPAPSAWAGGLAGQNKSAVVIGFTAPPAAILSGAENRALSRFFHAAPAGYPIYYSYDSEPEASVRAHRFTASQYRRAWARVARIAGRATNANLKPTLILRASDAAAGSARNWRSYLPAGDVISTLAWDAYPAGTLTGHNPRLTPPATVLAPAVAAARSAGLPFGVAGFALATAQGRPEWLEEFADFLMRTGALFGLLRTVPGAPGTQLTDHASIAAWRQVVASSGTDKPLPLGPAPVRTPGPAPASPASVRSAPPSPAPAPRPAPSPPAPAPTSAAPGPAPGPVCATTAARGECGPFADSQIMLTTSNTSVGNDVWSPVSGWSQTLHVTNPGDWSATANMPAGNTAVVSYPSLGANYGQTNGQPTPLSDFKSMYSSFTENMHATSKTSAWAAYDIWLGQGTSTSATTPNEVMIQHDFANNGPCTAVATATFGGSGGVPVQKWNLCHYGTELIWKLTGGNEQSGSVDILAMLNWLVARGYLPKNSGLSLIGYGWEICSTGGQNETFQVSNFSVTATK